MWGRVYAAVNWLLSSKPRPEAAEAQSAGSGDVPAGGRKRPRFSIQETGEQGDGSVKRFKMGDLVDSVKNTAEGVKQTTSMMFSWVKSRTPSFSSGLPALPAQQRLPIRRRRPPQSCVPLPDSESSLGESFVCPSREPLWRSQPKPAHVDLPTVESFMATVDQSVLVKRPLHSPRTLNRANGHSRNGAAMPRSRTQKLRLGNSLHLPVRKTPSRTVSMYTPVYDKTFSGRRADSPHRSSSTQTSPLTQRRSTGKYLSTVEETIRKEEKEIYRQLLEVVSSNHSNKLTLSRVSSPLSHRELSSFFSSNQHFFQKMVSDSDQHTVESSLVSSDPGSQPLSWADPSCSPLASSEAACSPPHAGNHISSSSSPRSLTPSLQDSLPLADTTSTGSDSESVIVVKVKEAPKRDRASVPRFDAVHWIKELTSMYDSRARDRRHLIDEQEALANRLRQQRLEDKDLLPRRVMTPLQVIVPLVEEIPIEEILNHEEEKAEAKPTDRGTGGDDSLFVQLTEEMEEQVSRAFRPGHPDEILSEAFRLTITRKDIQTLNHLNWLNDEVINFYMNLLVVRSKTKGLPSVHTFNTFFFPKVKSDGYQAVKRWTKKVDVFATNIVLVPVHLGVHWCLAVIDFRKKTITYYDSMGGCNDEACRILLRYLKQESIDKKGKEFDTNGWTLCSKRSQEIPQQMNGSDCGMFTCKYADYITKDRPIKFTQKHMPYFRRRMAWEILHQKLL